MPFELAALGSALCWSITGILSTAPSRHLGGIAYTRIRMLIVFVLMLAWTVPSGGFATIDNADWATLLLSGLVGIFIGDTALFTTMARLGPRRTGILFATNAPMTVAITWIVFDETLGWAEIAGCALVVLGVSIAIFYGRRANGGHALEAIHGKVLAGVALGLLAAFCQAVGALMAKPALMNGADPVAVTAVRVGVSALALHASLLLPITAIRARNAMNVDVLVRATAAGVIGMAFGMSLLLYAYGNGNAGIAAILSSTSPVIVLPLLWLVTRQRPSAGAWTGAVTCVAGTALILSRAL
ncbi:MAG: DMT family transporter [Proteobacteria bacterium]|nr:MAG: DMT family transporter [Pseudomonadota bacterium]